MLACGGVEDEEVFQSLTGRLKTGDAIERDALLMEAFQSLTGRLKTSSRAGSASLLPLFQSLTGRLKTVRDLANEAVRHRGFNPSQVG